MKNRSNIIALTSLSCLLFLTTSCSWDQSNHTHSSSTAQASDSKEQVEDRQIIAAIMTIDKNEIASIVRETVEEVLRENGLLIESTQRTKDNFTFKVGNHIFEGKLTKIKKVS